MVVYAVYFGMPPMMPTAFDCSVQHFVHCHFSYFVLPDVIVPFLCISVLHLAHCMLSPVIAVF